MKSGEQAAPTRRAPLGLQEAFDRLLSRYQALALVSAGSGAGAGMSSLGESSQPGVVHTRFVLRERSASGVCRRFRYRRSSRGTRGEVGSLP